MRFDAVLFDLDQTLMPEYASVDRAFTEAAFEAAQRWGLDAAALGRRAREIARPLWQESEVRPLALRVSISHWEALTGDFSDEGEPWRTLWSWICRSRYRVRCWERALAEQGVDAPALAGRIAESLPQIRLRHHRLYPDSVQVLQALRGRARMALVTNGVPRIQQGKIDAVGIGEYFDAVCISGQVGAAKPDAALIHAALKALGDVPPERAVMVGDGRHSDVAAARAAGVHSIWVRREDDPHRHKGVDPDEAIDELAELPARLGL
jgi:putative hydrolase of the HAD superfamily